MKLFLIFVNEPRTRGISSQKNSLFRELRVCGWTLITKVIKAGNGDSILLSFKESDEEHFHHILVDGGGMMAYENYLKLELIDIIKAGESIDLLIVTHIDRDHIGGIIKMFDDLKSGKLFWFDTNGIKKFLEIRKIWFNANALLKNKEFLLSSDTTKISISDGADLQLYIQNKIEYVNSFIVRPGNYENDNGVEYFGKNKNVKITVLSPTESYLTTYHEKISQEWNEKIKGLMKTKHIDNQIGATQSGCNKMKISDLMKIVEKQRNDNNEEIDKSPANLSSIAFLFECGKSSILLLGDAPPQTICKSLTDLGYSKDNTLFVDYTKLSHHAGIANTNYELLNMLDCKNFIISSNGQNSDLPNKATIAKIISAKGENLKFYFNYSSEDYPFSFLDTKAYQSETELHNFIAKFTKENDRGLIIK